MALRIILPVKPFAEAKQRLASVLTDAARARIAEDMFRHVFATACTFADARMVTVVSRAPDVLAYASAHGAAALAEKSSADLNNALLQAADALRARGVSRLLVVAGDLPLLCEADLAALARHDCAIAPDRPGTGTNALVWPETPRLEFHFGERSFDRHVAVAKAAGCNPYIVRRNGLAHDIDLPEDLIDGY